MAPASMLEQLTRSEASGLAFKKAGGSSPYPLLEVTLNSRWAAMCDLTCYRCRHAAQSATGIVGMYSICRVKMGSSAGYISSMKIT